MEVTSGMVKAACAKLDGIIDGYYVSVFEETVKEAVEAALEQAAARDRALGILEFHATTGIPMHPRDRAKLVAAVQPLTDEEEAWLRSFRESRERIERARAEENARVAEQMRNLFS